VGLRKQSKRKPRKGARGKTPDSARLQAFKEASAELEAEMRRLGLSPACDVDADALNRLKKEIRARGSHQLKAWADAGVPEEVLLQLLASVALTPEGCVDAILSEMRNRQADLKSLAGRLETVAQDAAVSLARPSASADWWFCLHGGGRSIGMPPPRPPNDAADVSQALSRMNALSEALDFEQRRFGSYLRAAGQADPGIVQLLVSCWACRCHRRNQAGERNPLRYQLDHLDDLASLLKGAFSSAGNTRVFSADGLRRVFERHAVPLLKLFFED
jgi:hypothetical protein